MTVCGCGRHWACFETRSCGALLSMTLFGIALADHVILRRRAKRAVSKDAPRNVTLGVNGYRHAAPA